MLRRSGELDEEIFTILDPSSYSPREPSKKLDAAIGLALVATEHGRSLRALVARGLMPSATRPLPSKL